MLALCDRLRSHGIDAWLDQYETSPPEGWPRWCAAQVQEADFVLVVCTEIYERRFRLAGESGRAFGVAWEGHIITQELSEAGGRNTRFIPVLFSPASRRQIPATLLGTTYYEPGPDEGYWRLYRRLTGQPEVSAPALGEYFPVPPRERKLSFSPTPRYEDERTRTLAEALETAHRRLEELTVCGGDPHSAREEILELRRAIREGGRLVAGDLLAEGRFKLIEPVGQGGFASVWKAYDRLRCELVAIKVLHGFHVGDRTRRERFFRGARKMAELRHPGIARVIEPELEDGAYHFFALEYVSGGDLRQAVLEGRLSREETPAMIVRVGEALAYAHGKGVVHRDVKPANILLAGSRPKLTDFDLVRAPDTTGGTQFQGMLGTFLYSAPEMLSRPSEAGVAADVFSLAMTTIFALHGEDLSSIVYRAPESLLSSLSCPQAVQRLLARAISWEPAQRPRTMTQFCRELQQAFGQPDPRPLAVPEPVRAPAQSSAQAEGREPEPPRRARAPAPPGLRATQTPPKDLKYVRVGRPPIMRRRRPSFLRLLVPRALGVLLLSLVALALLQRSPARIDTRNVLLAALGTLGDRLSPVLFLLSMAVCGLFLVSGKDLSDLREIWERYRHAWTRQRARRENRREKELLRKRVIAQHLRQVAEEKQRGESQAGARLEAGSLTEQLGSGPKTL